MNTVTGRAVLGSCGRNGMVVLETDVSLTICILGKVKGQRPQVFLKCVCMHVSACTCVGALVSMWRSGNNFGVFPQTPATCLSQMTGQSFPAILLSLTPARITSGCHHDWVTWVLGVEIRSSRTYTCKHFTHKAVLGQDKENPPAVKLGLHNRKAIGDFTFF